MADKKKLSKKNPFPGLRPFGVEEKDLFFGRDEAVSELLRKIKGLRFIAVVGKSGSGKTSLVNGGLIPKLQKGFIGQGGTDWRVAIFQPGRDPIGNLANALAKRKVLHRDIRMEPNYPFYVEETLKRSSRGLVDAYITSYIHGKSNLLVVIDQFEELFKFHEEEKKAKKKDREAPTFVNLLLTAIKERDIPIYIVITMRADFFGEISEFRGLPEMIGEGQYVIPVMKREEFKEVFTGPIRYVKQKISPKLKSRLTDKINGEVQLPLLQHALMRMFDNWQKKGSEGLIGLSHYEEIGGIDSALSEHIEEAFAELESEEQKIHCERIFKALSNKGSDGRITRLSLPFDILCKTVGGNTKEVKEILDIFRKEGRSFITPRGTGPINNDTSISLTHESLIKEWEKSEKWVNEELQSGETYMRLAAAAALYFKGQTGIYRNPELQIASNWQHKNQPNETWAQRYNPNFNQAIEFLNKSKEQTQVEITHKEEQRHQQLAKAKKFTRTVSIIAAVGLLLAVVSIILFIQANGAAREAKKAQKELKEKQEESLYLALQAQKAQEEAEVKGQEAIEQTRLAQDKSKAAQINEIKAKQSAERAKQSVRKAKQSAAAATRSAKIASQKEEEAQKARTIAERAQLKAEAETEKAAKAEAKAKVSKAKAERTQKTSLAETLALEAANLGGDYGEIKSLISLEAFNLHTNKDAPSIHAGLDEGLRILKPKDFDSKKNQKGAIRDIAITSTGNRFYSVGSDGKLYQWVVNKWQKTGTPVLGNSGEPAAYPLTNQVINSISLDRKNQFMVLGGKRGSVYIINQNTLNSRRLTAHDGSEVLKIGVLPDGKGYISSGSDKTIREFESKSNNEKILFSNATIVTALDVTKDGRFLVWAESGNCYVYDRTTRKKRRIDVETKPAQYVITSVKFSNRGRALVIAYKGVSSRIGIVKYYQKSQDKFIFAPNSKTLQHTSNIVDIAFNKNDTKFATGSRDGTAKVWDIEKLNAPETYLPITLQDKEGSWAISVEFSRNSEQLIVGYRTGKMKFWTLNTEFIANEICKELKRDLTINEWETYIGNNEPYKKVRRNCKKN